MPLGKDVGDNITELRKAHPDWTEKHIRAAALSGAEAAGNPDVKPPKNKNGSKPASRGRGRRR